MDTADNTFIIRESINRATEKPELFYTKQGFYVIVDDIAKLIVQVRDKPIPLHVFPV